MKVTVAFVVLVTGYSIGSLMSPARFIGDDMPLQADAEPMVSSEVIAVPLLHPPACWEPGEGVGSRNLGFSESCAYPR
jgi:hypothetical protein